LQSCARYVCTHIHMRSPADPSTPDSLWQDVLLHDALVEVARCTPDSAASRLLGEQHNRAQQCQRTRKQTTAAAAAAAAANISATVVGAAAGATDPTAAGEGNSSRQGGSGNSPGTGVGQGDPYETEGRAGDSAAGEACAPAPHDDQRPRGHESAEWGERREGLAAFHGLEGSCRHTGRL